MLVGEHYAVDGVGQWGITQAAQQAAKLAADAAKRTFNGRVEVKDAATGNYIPAAAVSLLYGPLDYPEGAGHVKTSLTDAGGNAKFMKVTTLLPGERFWYRVSAPGYAAQDIPADSGVIAAVNLAKVGSDPTPTPTPVAKSGIPIVALAVGGVVVLGIIGYLAFKG
jgi:hypothetical protein